MGTIVRRPRRRHASWWTILLLLLFVGPVAADDGDEPAPAPAAPPAAAPPDDGVPPALDERIKTAVDRGVAYLRSKARADGSWGPLDRADEQTYNGTTNSYTSPYGATSLALYTLMKCGVEASDPLVKRGLAWLKASKGDGDAYETSMELLAVTATADPFKKSADSSAAGAKIRLSGENRAWADGLLANLLKLRGALGWRYWGKKDDTKGGGQDLSSTQLAVLAMFAAERCGLRVDPKIWSDVILFALDQQEADGPARRRAVHPRAKASAAPAGRSEGTTAGPAASDEGAPGKARGFAYLRMSGSEAQHRVSTGAMTACGLGILTMARFSLTTRSPKVWSKVDAPLVQSAIYDGFAWLDMNWSPYENTGYPEHWSLYYVYCVERAMDLVGSQRLGDHVWYLEMAGQVLGRQKQDGSWAGGAGTTYNVETLDTCFALLFLQRATRGGIPYPSVTGGSDTGPSDSR